MPPAAGYGQAICARIVDTADFAFAAIAKFLESIGKKVAPSDREPKYMQSSSWRYMDDKQKP